MTNYIFVDFMVISYMEGNVRQQIKIKDTLEIQNEDGIGTYLGIPKDIGRSKWKLFAFLKEKLTNIVNGKMGR